MRTQDRINSLERQVATVAAKVDALINESNQQRQDIREMNKKIDDNQKEFMQQLHNNFVQTLIGVGAIMVAVGGLIIAVLK